MFIDQYHVTLYDSLGFSVPSVQETESSLRPLAPRNTSDPDLPDSARTVTAIEFRRRKASSMIVSRPLAPLVRFPEPSWQIRVGHVGGGQSPILGLLA